MKFSELIAMFQDRPFFEVGEVRIAFDESPEQIEARLSRWVKEGKIISLRRTKYLLHWKHQRQEASLGYIANFMYRPSYISLRTALELHGLIPEAAMIQESVTTRKTAEWSNKGGTFKYYSMQNDRFWGYRLYPEQSGRGTQYQQRFLLAEPEKTIIDLFYLMKGEWTDKRIREMRFQDCEKIDREKLELYRQKFNSPKVTRAVNRFIKIYLRD
jgi:predicted transcriptional regulator of viral defense system